MASARCPWAHLPSFYAKQNHVYRPDLAGTVGGFGGLYDDLPDWRFHAQAMRLNRFQVLSARDEGDVLARSRAPK